MCLFQRLFRFFISAKLSLALFMSDIAGGFKETGSENLAAVPIYDKKFVKHRGM